MNHYTNGQFYSTSTMPIIKAADGCSFWRTQLPYIYGGLDLEKAKETPIENYYENAKLVTFNRSPGNYTDAWKDLLTAKAKYNFQVCFDMDDYWELNPRHMLKREWDAKKLDKTFPQIMGKMEAITVTTERLADKVRPINPNVYVIPNAVPFDSGSQFSYVDKEIKEVRFWLLWVVLHTITTLILSKMPSNIFRV
ncbi:MAG: hypothetical protein WDM78_11565 [Puia sp.]